MRFTVTTNVLKILVKSDLLILYDNGIIKWTETFSVSGETNSRRKHYVSQTAMHFVYYILVETVTISSVPVGSAGKFLQS
jgi:hypothetical protein